MARGNSSTIDPECRAYVVEAVMLKSLLLLGLIIGASPALAAKVGLSGEVTYRERIALPDTAILKIELIDLAFPDRPRVSVSAPTGAGQVPLAFTLTFDDSMILPQHEYALNAKIVAGTVSFRNAAPFRVTPLAQTDPILIVAQSLSPSEQPSTQPIPTEDDLALLNVTWHATAIGETPVPPGVDISLLIEADMRAGGVGGCNSYFSQATLTKDTFALGELARTQRSCGYDRNMLEVSFFEALKSTTSWIVDGETLSLLDAAGKPTVTFER
jgi:putative lipoprotein